MPKLGMEEIRRRQLIEATIASIHEVGFSESSISRIAATAGVSTGIVHHYFKDKADLLEATLRDLGNSLSRAVIARLRRARSAEERLMAVIEGNLGPEHFTPLVVSAWLAFWAMVPNNPRLARVQTIIIRRLHSNLLHALRPFAGPKHVEDVARALDYLIDGMWLRAALDPNGPNPAEARRAIGDYLKHRLKIDLAWQGETQKLARVGIKTRAP